MSCAQAQARLEQQLKDEFGDIPREEMRKVVRERMKSMAEKDAASMLEASGEVVNVNTVAQKLDEMQKDSSECFSLAVSLVFVSVLGCCLHARGCLEGSVSQHGCADVTCDANTVVSAVALYLCEFLS